jgi:hypothetical protein
VSKLFLDSGAFSAYSNNTSINIEEYISFIKEHQSEIEIHANLDDIGDADKTWKNQRKMERAGLSPIPVYHLDEDPKYLRWCMEYPYFAVGGLASAKGVSLSPFLDSVFRKVCTKKSDFLPTHKVHGFGIATPEILCRYPWFSVDSTSWVMYGRYGIVLIPRRLDNKFRYDIPPYTLAVSSRSKAVGDEKHFRNFSKMEKEWIVEYCESKGCPMGRTLYRAVTPSYVLKPNEKWTDKNKKDRVEVIVDKGLCCDGEMRDRLNLLYFLDLEKNQKPWPWRWLLEETPLFS